MKNVLFRILLSGSLIVNLAWQLPAQSTWSKIKAGDAAADDGFGQEISLDGNRALIGASANDEMGNNAGSAYIFEYSGGTWNQIIKLTASDPIANHRFGASVSLDGDRALIGATGDADNGIDGGAVYVFELDGGSWSETDKITASDGVMFENFGKKIDLDGDRAIIFSQGDPLGKFAGSVYVFDYGGGTWTESDRLATSDGELGDEFGFGLSLDGDRIAIGAPGDSSFTGALYIYDNNAGSWGETIKLIAGDAVEGDYFGWSVSLDSNRVLVGAFREEEVGTDAGAAYIFEESGGSWVETDKLTDSNGAANDAFGVSVSLGKNLAVVGSYLDDEGVLNNGSVLLFEYAGGSWSELDKITAPDPEFNHDFGVGVSLDNNRLLIGAVGDSMLSGAAYVLELDSLGSTSIETLPADLLSVYPNPFQQSLQVSWSGFSGDVYLLRLTTLDGKEILTRVVSPVFSPTMELHTGNLPAGVYLLEVRSKDQRMVKQLVKQ